MRKTHSKEFKFKVALEAIRGDLTIAEIVSRYQVADSLVHKWKKRLLEEGGDIFSSSKSSKSSPEQDLEKLHAKIGQLTLQLDFLEKALWKSR